MLIRRLFGSGRGPFDRALKRVHRDAVSAHPQSRVLSDGLRDEVAARLVERLRDLRGQQPLRQVLDMGAHSGSVLRALNEEGMLHEGRIEGLTMLEPAERMLRRDEELMVGADSGVQQRWVVLDEEGDLPGHFGPGAFDVVLSCLSLHWVNDVVGMLGRTREVLRPDGVFMGAMFGGDTLEELRTCFTAAGLEREGGVSQHVSPMANASDVGNLVQRAGFALPTVDTEKIVVQYPDVFSLMEHLWFMGESNAVLHRRTHLPLESFVAVASLYEELYPRNDQGMLEATFQVVFLIGWNPDSSQPQPKERGSASFSLADLATHHQSGEVQ